MVASLSKRAASSGEKIVLAISLTLHHLPRQPFGGQVHLFGDTVQFNRSIFLHAEGGAVSFTVLKRLVREAKPTAGDTEGDLVFADLDDCVMPAVESVGCSVRAKQRCPGGPKFCSEAENPFCLRGIRLRSHSPSATSIDPMHAATAARDRPLDMDLHAFNWADARV